ncbi:phage holin [Priestia aryabhattai]|uniref:phage holin n=1 Tax=Priestia aryabhattai TaxID=412384 RepID=UPI003D2E9AE8
MLKKIRIRIQNKKVILAIISGILIILVNLEVIDIDVSKKAMAVAHTILALLVTVGIVGDPESHVTKDKD